MVLRWWLVVIVVNKRNTRDDAKQIERRANEEWNGWTMMKVKVYFSRPTYWIEKWPLTMRSTQDRLLRVSFFFCLLLGRCSLFIVCHWPTDKARVALISVEEYTKMMERTTYLYTYVSCHTSYNMPLCFQSIYLTSYHWKHWHDVISMKTIQEIWN